MEFAAFMHDVAVTPQGLQADIPDAWRQGRTAYGGISTALCLAAARAHVDDDRPLRSALIAFVGPAAGLAQVSAEPLRAGRTASSVRARLTGEAGIGVEAVFTFAAPRESRLSVRAAGFPAGVAAPDAGASGFAFPTGAPQFTANFEILPAAGGAVPFSGQGAGGDGTAPPLRFWTRHVDPASRQGLDALVCLADALPPAITTAMDDFAPLSSMSWMIDMLDDDLSTREGWYLLESVADHAAHGYSSQAMTIWSADGRCLVKGRQMVTVFA
jgi:acyl-CoA thioesterase